MKTFTMQHEGQGVGCVDPATLSNAQRVVVDGLKVHVYEHGDVVPEEHAHETLTKGKKPAPAKKKS